MFHVRPEPGVDRRGVRRPVALGDEGMVHGVLELRGPGFSEAGTAP